MDLEMFKQLAELDEKIYNLKIKNVRFESEKEIFNLISHNNDLNKLNFVNDFVKLISENLKKMSALTLALMNQADNSDDCIFKLKKEFKSVLIEYFQRLINFTLNDNGEIIKSGLNMKLDEQFNPDEIEPIYDLIIKKLDAIMIKDNNQHKLLNEIADDFRKICDQLNNLNSNHNQINKLNKNN